MVKWQYYRIKSKVIDKHKNLSVIDILADELECNHEDIEWLYEKNENHKLLGVRK